MEPSGSGIPHGEGRCQNDLRQQLGRPRNIPALHSGGSESQSAGGRSAQAIAKRKKATPARIALAWLLAQKPWIVPIPGTRKLERMVENSGAAEIELTSADLREIESAFAKTTVQGARLSAGTHEADRSLIDRKAAICELVFSVPD